MIFSNHQNYKLTTEEEKMKRRADILYPTMRDEKKIPKNLPLGKSAFDDDDEDDDNSNSKTIKGIPKVKGSELDALDEFDKHKKSSSNSKNENQASYKSRKERTPEEDEEILDLMYPSMKNIGKKEDTNKIPETSSKKETDENMQNNIEKKENSDVYKNKNDEKNDKTNDISSTANIKKGNDYEIAGVKKGQAKSLDEAFKNVNPGYQRYGNINKRTNCQTDAIATDLQTRGYNVEASIDYDSDIKRKIASRPNIAYIDPKTGKEPEFMVSKEKTAEDCKKWLENNIKQGEKHIFVFQWEKKLSSEKNSGHAVIIIKDENNQLKIYDSQNQTKKENINEYLEKIKHSFSWNEEKCPPKILRVDDKEPNLKILNQILKPSSK